MSWYEPKYTKPNQSYLIYFKGPDTSPPQQTKAESKTETDKKKVEPPKKKPKTIQGSLTKPQPKTSVKKSVKRKKPPKPKSKIIEANFI